MNESTRQYQNRFHRVGLVILLVLSFSFFVMPLVSVASDIQATPVVEPTPTEETVEVPTQEQKQEPVAPTPTAEVATDASTDASNDEPQVEAREMIAPLSVTPEGAIMRCGPNFETIAPNSEITVECTLETNQGNTRGFRISRPQLSNGYQAEIRLFSSKMEPRGHLPMHSDAADAYFAYGDTSFILHIVIKSGDSPVFFDQTFAACALNAGNQASCVGHSQGSVRITLNPAPPVITLREGTDYTFNCDSVQPGSVDLNAAATADCKIVGQGTTNMRLDRLNWSLTGAEGWDVSILGHLLVGAEGAFAPLEAITINGGGERAIPVELIPTGCSSSSSIVLTLSVDLTPVGQNVGTSTSSSRTLSATFAPEQFTQASVVSAPDAVGVDYSMSTKKDGEASFKVQYIVSGCGDWVGQVETDGFTNELDQSVTTVPVWNSVYSGDVSVVSGDDIPDLKPAGVTAVGTDPASVVIGTAPANQAVVEQTVNLKFTVPANTPVGSYESIIKVSTAAGP